MAPEEPQRTLTPLERLIADYRRWLIVERDLAAPTVLRYEKLARRSSASGSRPRTSWGQAA